MDHTGSIEMNRDVWCDQDFNGHWLVAATEHDGAMGNHAGGDTTGAMLVKSPEVMAFLTLLGKLIVDPAAFQHEPVFTGVETATDEPLTVVSEHG